jgi:hypothetical protein
MFRGYVVNDIPAEFRASVTTQLLGYLRELVKSSSLRRTMGQAALSVARSRFSIDRRRALMGQIYHDAIR